MAKPKAPLFGLGASGQLGKVIVYGSWKGIDVAREYVVPANPRTAAQTAQRAELTAAVAEWHAAPPNSLEANDKSAWNRYAGVLGPMSGFNAYAKAWMLEHSAGGTPLGHFFDDNVTDDDAALFAGDVEHTTVAAGNVTRNLGNSKTFFSLITTVAAVAGVATFPAEDTLFAAGTRVYWYYTAGNVGADRTRSGLYSIILT